MVSFRLVSLANGTPGKIGDVDKVQRDLVLDKYFLQG